MDKCHLCEKKRELKVSHVWPAFAYKRYVSDLTKGGRFVDLFTMTVHNKQYKQRWFCEDCEKWLCNSERSTANLCDRLEADPDANQAYDEHLLRFATSVSWRTLKLYYDDKTNAGIENLWPAANHWMRYLRGTRPGIQPYSQHIYVVNDNPQGLDKMLGGHVIEMQSLVFSQIGPLLIVGHMRPKKLSSGEMTIWKRSQLKSTGGSLKPLRVWIAGRGDLDNQNITLPFYALLASHQTNLGERAREHAAARKIVGIEKQQKHSQELNEE
jgi:hypothetical protein